MSNFFYAKFFYTVIKQLEKHVAELTQEGENVEEMKLLEKMETSFQKVFFHKNGKKTMISCTFLSF